MCTLASNTEMRMLAGGIVGLLCAGAARVAGACRRRDRHGRVRCPISPPTAPTAWVPDRPAGDDFLPPASGPGPGHVR